MSATPERGTSGCGQLAWSAFGARYPDTECVGGGQLLDLDSLVLHDQPCPLCDPIGFFEWGWGGGYVEPTCSICLTRLPPTALTFRQERRLTLTWTVECPTCKATQPGLMRDYEPAAAEPNVGGEGEG